MKRWTQQDLKVLREHYPIANIETLSMFLDRTQISVRIQAHRYGIKRDVCGKENLVLTKKEEQTIIGGLLGDLSCRKTHSSLHPRLEGGHCFRQREYLLWKTVLLKRLSWNIWVSKEGTYHYNSKTFPVLHKYHSLFYADGVKRIDENILSLVDDFGLLIWYLDDGSYKTRDKNVNIHTNGFDLEEQIIIQNWFFEKYGLIPRIYEAKDHKNYPGKVWYYLHFNKKDTEKLLNIFRKFDVPACIRYKLGYEISHSTSSSVEKPILVAT
ncbi:hypothetical protein GOV11_04475 [Candidatus Woesearchaeota archaeon]|nr:hypothetical protein [Candidatus Woesearchaeota archaeon]